MEIRQKALGTAKTRKTTRNPTKTQLQKIFRFTLRVLERSILAIMILAFIFPFLWMASTSIKAFSETLIFPPKWIPERIILENYARVLSSGPFLRYFFNSVFVTVSILMLQLLIMIPAAYAFARYEFKFKKILFGITLLSLMVPEQITFIPIYLQMSSWNLLKTHAPLILPFAASAFGIFLLRQAFMQIPDEIIEAAKLDNASEWRIMWKIMVPMTKTVLVTFSLFSIIYHWNAYFWPLVMTNTPDFRTLPIAIAMLKNSEGLTQWNVVMAGNMILVMPILAIYFFAQKQIVKAFVYSGIK